MNNNLILFIKAYNILSITKKITLITAIFVNGVYFYLNASVELGGSSEFGNMIASVGKQILILVDEHPVRTLFYSGLVTFALMIILVVVELFFSRTKGLRCSSRPMDNLLDAIKEDYLLPSWVRCKVHRNKTFTRLNRLYISMEVLMKINDVHSRFILHHEAFHLRSLDSVFGVFEKALSIICALFIGMFLSGEIERAVATRIGTAYIPIVIIISMLIMFWAWLYVEFIYTRYKEHVCDFYAVEKSKHKMLFYSKKNKILFTLLHPTNSARNRYINDRKWSAKIILFLYEIISYSILLYLFFSNDLLISIIDILALLFFINTIVIFRVFRFS